jgi:hypothetical protein
MKSRVPAAAICLAALLGGRGESAQGLAPSGGAIASSQVIPAW